MVLLIGVLALPLAPFIANSVQVLMGRGAQAAAAGGDRRPELPGAAFTMEDIRFELLSSLDLLVRAQKALQQENGAFSSALGRVPDILGPSAGFYRVEILRATRNRLVVSATGAVYSDWVPVDMAQDLSRDSVTVDENWSVRANFPLPLPPSGYLRVLAQNVMARIQTASASRIPERSTIDAWEGIFRGHFSYEIRVRSSGGATVVAVPLTDAARAAAGGGELVMEAGAGDLLGWVSSFRQQMFSDVSAKLRLRNLYLAQKIRQRLMGTFAASIEDLALIDGSLKELTSSASNLHLDNLELDPASGYQAEVAVIGDGDQIRNLWSVNAYGQTIRINPVEELMGRLEDAQENLLAPGRRVSSDDSPAVRGKPQGPRRR